jgi:DNA-binding transcriptional regulator YhcF (GntR family)
MEEEFCRHRNPIEQLGFAQLRHIATIDPEISDGAYRTYALYLMYAQQSGKGWPSRERMAKERNVNDATISRHNAELESLGYITRQRRTGHSSITIMESIDLIPRLKELATNYLHEREDAKAQRELDAMSNVAELRHEMLQNRDVEEEPKKNNQLQSSARKNRADEDDAPELEYAALDEDGYPQDTNPTDSEPIIQYIVSEARRNVTPTQAKKLKAGVPFHNPKYPAPSVLFQRDKLFQQFVSEKIKWATGAFDGKRKTTGSLVSAICKYETERFGWLDYKQNHEERKELEAEMTHTKPDTPPPYQLPEQDPEELVAFYKELGVGRNGKKLTEDEIRELVRG